ncbi:MAG: imidazole glycerol phosphate synthase subunit HisF [Actinomycetota bacterium]
MLRRRIIPCLDVSGGRVVKGVEFVNLRDCGEPVDAALRYAEQGADEICWLNITAGDESWHGLLAQVEDAGTRIDVPLTVGGGVSDEPHVRDLLGAGADKVSINSAALDRPGLVAECAERHGSQCIVVAIDARRGPDGAWEAVASGGRRPTGRDAVAWAVEAVARGAGELLVTSMDQDGTQAGYAIDLYARLLDAVDVPIIASGGASGPADIADVLEAGVSAALAASIFHDAISTVEEVKDACRARSLPMR